jgi:AcrR family transcriptional regulator
MARKTKEEAERTYHVLLDSATILFMHQGVAQTTLNDIAAEAGMTRGAVYWHFDNKDAVIQALWERNASILHETFTNELRHLDPANSAQHFRKVIKQLVRSVVEQPEIGQVIGIVMHSVEFTEEKTDLQRFLNNKHQVIHEVMEEALETLHRRDALRSQLPPKLLAQSTLCYLLGLIHVYLEPGQTRLNLKQDGDQMLELFLDTFLDSSKPINPMG